MKPPNQWYTSWNADGVPARILEIISPAGLKRFFAEIVGWVFGHPSVPLVWLVLSPRSLGGCWGILITSLVRSRTREPRPS